MDTKTNTNIRNCFYKEECIENTFPTTPKPKENDKNQFIKLLSLEKIEQRTPQWYTARKNMITASDWAAALNEGKFKSRNDLILKKCGKGKVFKGSIYTEWGVKYEDVAIRIYEVCNGKKIYEFGVLQHPVHKFLGASPDGITGDGIMIEIKCPFKRKIIIGKVPENYRTQIQGQLEVCDLDICDYLECDLEEYDTEDDYFNDTFDEKSSEKKIPVHPSILENEIIMDKYNKKRIFNKTKNGMDKGVTLVYENKDKVKKYIHSELGISKEELIDWKENLEKYSPNPNWKFREITYWKINKFNCVRINRDKNWFEEALPKLKEVWNMVEKYRKIGCESIMKKPKEKKIEIIKENPLEDLQNMFSGIKISAKDFF